MLFVANVRQVTRGFRASKQVLIGRHPHTPFDRVTREFDHLLLLHLLQQTADDFPAGVQIRCDFLMCDAKLIAPVGSELLVQIKDQTLVQRAKCDLVITSSVSSNRER